jgi:hypothetical protein
LSCHKFFVTVNNSWITSVRFLDLCRINFGHLLSWLYHKTGGLIETVGSCHCCATSCRQLFLKQPKHINFPEPYTNETTTQLLLNIHCFLTNRYGIDLKGQSHDRLFMIVFVKLLPLPLPLCF